MFLKYIRANRITIITFIIIAFVTIYHLMNIMLPKMSVNPYIYFELPHVAGHTEINAIESSLSHVISNSSSELLLNSSSESALGKAEVSLAFSNQKASPERLKFLIQKSFIGPMGKDLSQVLFKYHEYKNQERYLNKSEVSVTNSEASTLESIQQERRIMKERESLQIKFLGRNIASALYGRQNQLAHILIDLRAIELNTELSTVEKRRENTRLQNKLNQIMQKNSHE